MPKLPAKPPCKLPGETLLDTVIRLLRHRDKTLTLEDVAAGSDCTVSFLSSLLSPNPPKRPGVNAIQRLYEFLHDELQY